MTTQEIKDLIASAIAGQGNQVDAGGKLAEILNALADAAGGGGATVIEGKGVADYDINIQLLPLLESKEIPNVTVIIPQEEGGELSGELKTTVVAVTKQNGKPPVVTLFPSGRYYLEYTETQYEGLNAIQRAKGFLAAYAKHVALTTYGYPEDDEPFIYLADSEANGFICVDDKLLVCTADGDGKIVSLERSDITEEGELGHTNISWEDAQKLIGVYLQ